MSAKKIKALLAYLAMQPNTVHQREYLAELLWEDCSVNQARHNLRQTISTLRKLLPDQQQLLTTDQQTVTLNCELLDVDVIKFDRLSAQEDETSVREAVGLYQGELLQGLFTHCQGFDNWLETERSQRREKFIQNLDILLAQSCEAGDAEEMIRLGIRLTALDPLRESAHRVLMEAYRLQGRRGAALKQYRLCQQVLRDELGIAPESATQTLYQTIYRQQSHKRTKPKQTTPAVETKFIDIEPITEALPSIRQLRQVTLLYARIERNENQADPETHYQQQQQTCRDVLRKLSRYQAQTVELHDGNLLFLFGLSVARTSDTEKAVRAAFALQQCLSSLSDCTATIGISSGQLFVPDIDGGKLQAKSVTGIPVQLVMRLTESAPPGEIWVTEQAYTAISSVVQSKQLDIKDPVENKAVWRLIGFHEHSLSSDTALVGREFELQQFQSALQNCLENNQGRIFQVRGEPGIGKTRLLAEWQKLAEDRGFACHCATVVDFGTAIDQHPAQVLLRSLLHLPSEVTTMELKLRLQQAVVDSQLSPDQQDFLFDLLNLPELIADNALYRSMDNEARQEGKQEIFNSLVRCASSRNPLLLVVEDIHWAEPAFLSALGHLAAAVKDEAVIFVFTSRVEIESQYPLWRSYLQRVSLTTLDLSPLGQRESIALLSQRVKLPEEKALQIADRAGGNPLFLEQLIFCVGQPMDNIPASVQNIVAAKLDTLDALDKHAVFAASILGQRFDQAVLCFMIDEPDYCCTALTVNGLIEPEGTRFRFHHALIMEGIYTIQLPSQRRSLHRLAADWYRNKDPVLHAEHLDKAEDETAAEAYLAAAQFLFQRQQFDETCQLAERGRQLSSSAETSFKLAICHGNSLRELGQNQPSLQTFVIAEQSASSSADRCRALIGQAVALRLLDRHDEVLTVTGKAEPLAVLQQDYEALANINNLRGNAYFFLGHLDDCLAAHQQAEKLANEHHLPLLEVRALSGIADAYYGIGRLLTAEKKYRHCIELSKQHGFIRDTAVNLLMAGSVANFSIRYNESKRLLTESLEMSIKVRNHRAEAMCLAELTYIALQMGDLRTARQYCEKNLELTSRLGFIRIHCDNLLYLGTIENSEALLEKAYSIAKAHRFGAYYISSWILAVLAWVCNDPDRSEYLLTEGENILQKHSLSHNCLMFYRYAIEACLKNHQLARAEYFCNELERYTATEPLAWSDFVIQRGRCLIRTGQGEQSEKLTEELKAILSRIEETRFIEAKAAVVKALQRRLKSS